MLNTLSQSHRALEAFELDTGQRMNSSRPEGDLFEPQLDDIDELPEESTVEATNCKSPKRLTGRVQLHSCKSLYTGFGMLSLLISSQSS